jgi:hypothetical protein
MSISVSVGLTPRSSTSIRPAGDNARLAGVVIEQVQRLGQTRRAQYVRHIGDPLSIKPLV